MKRIGKLSINPEKIIKNEELVNLKGGYSSGTCAAIHEGIILCNISKTDAIFHASCEYSDGTNCEGNGVATVVLLPPGILVSFK